MFFQGVTARTIHNWQVSKRSLTMLQKRYVEGYDGDGFKLKTTEQKDYHRGPRNLDKRDRKYILQPHIIRKWAHLTMVQRCEKLNSRRRTATKIGPQALANFYKE